MATLLLLVIYIAFAGLGVPDSLFGAAWPAIYADFGVPVGFNSIITVIIAAGTILSSLNASKVMIRFGTKTVAAVSTLKTALALLGFSFSHHFVWLCVFSIPVGFGAGAIDAALNNYVALHYKATHMNFMQCFYGLGVAVSPYLLSLSLASVDDWHMGYRSVFWVQLGIAMIIFLSFPLWNRKGRAESQDREEVTQKAVPIKELVKNSKIRIALVMCFATCGIEFMCAGWGSTYLVEARGMSVELGAKMIILYYAGLTVGRFLAGVLAAKIHPWRIIVFTEGVATAGVICMLIPSATLALIGLFLLGFNAVLAPNILYLAPESFGAEISGSVTGLEMASMYVGVLAAPALFGLLTNVFPVAIYPVYIAVIVVVLILSTVLLKKKLKEETR